MRGVARLPILPRPLGRPSALPAFFLMCVLAAPVLYVSPLPAQEADRTEEADAGRQVPTGAIVGQVTDALRGDPMAALEVRVAETELSARTDPAGEFVLWEVPAGTRQLRVTLPRVPGLGALTLGSEVRVESGAVAEVVFERPGPAEHRDLLCGDRADSLPPEGALAGRVRRDDGAPVAGAELAFGWEGDEVPLLESLLGAFGRGAESRATLRTDTAGRFAACGVPLDRPVELVAGETTRTVTLTAGRPFRMVELGAERAAGATVTLRLRTEGGPPAIAGRVRDAHGRTPLAAARVELLGTDREVATDPEGRFRIEPVEPGSHRIAVSHVGRGTDTVGVRVEEGATTEVRLAMERVPVELPELEATVRADAPRALRGFEERLERGWGRVLGRDEIEADPAPLASYVARKNIYGPGVLMKRILGDYCQPRLYRDGSRVDWLWEVSLPPGQEGNPLYYFEKDEVAAVEIYPGGQVPPEFGGSTNGCGAIVVWTRAYVNRYGPR